MTVHSGMEPYFAYNRQITERKPLPQVRAAYIGSDGHWVQMRGEGPYTEREIHQILAQAMRR
jgi:hypothetical protein